MTTNQIPIQPGLFTWPSEQPQLIGSRCRDNQVVAFPAQKNCPFSGSLNVEEIRLSRRGRLWTWTVQAFPPPAPYSGSREGFQAFGVGYIELPEGLRVESRLTISDPAKLRIGMLMELVIVPFDQDASGNTRMTFAFQPVEE